MTIYVAVVTTKGEMVLAVITFKIQSVRPASHFMSHLKLHTSRCYSRWKVNRSQDSCGAHECLPQISWQFIPLTFKIFYSEPQMSNGGAGRKSQMVSKVTRIPPLGAEKVTFPGSPPYICEVLSLIHI